MIKIGICGKKRAGKNYVAEAVKRELESHGVTVELRAFADPVKYYAELVTEWRIREMFEELVKEGLDRPLIFQVLIRLLLLRINPWIMRTDESGKRRRLLQKVGTDVFRKHVDGDYWVNLAGMTKCHADVLMYTDTRFPNEAEICDVLWRVVGPDSVEEAKDKHPSEDTGAFLRSVPEVPQDVIFNTKRGEEPNVSWVTTPLLHTLGRIGL